MPAAAQAPKIARAPFDLGVIQAFWLAIHPTDDPHIFEVQITLQRQAGSPRAWLRLNRPFLVSLREQFLLWRNLSPDTIARYTNQSIDLFATATPISPPIL